MEDNNDALYKKLVENQALMGNAIHALTERAQKQQEMINNLLTLIQKIINAR